MKAWINIIGTSTLLLAATAGAAQDWIGASSPMDHMQTMRVVTNGFINKSVNEQAFGFGSTGRQRTTSAPLRGSAPIPNSLITRSAERAPGTARSMPLPYRSSPAAEQQAKVDFLDRLRAKDPETAKIAAVQFQKNDMGRVYAGITRPFGLSPNDAGDVMTAYLVLGWIIANGAGDPSPAAVRAARAHVGSLLAQSGQIADPATRAAVAEEVKILFVVMHSGWQSARKEGSVRQYADGTAQLFRTEMGDDLRRIVLTDAGFRPRG